MDLYQIWYRVRVRVRVNPIGGPLMDVTTVPNVLSIGSGVLIL